MMMVNRRQETVLHFVGIGGIGMSGIAEVFLNQGYQVTGSDLSQSDTTKRLADLGARITFGHQAENIHGAHVVVVSSAVKPTNPEVVEARRLRIPVIPRAEMLGELMRGKIGISVAGSHGKTTTTSMLASVLVGGGVDPTIVIGGKVDALGGSNAKLGQGQYVVAEADESDGSFLHLPGTFGVITNIDNDHLDHFGHLGAIEDAFVGFVAKIPFYGLTAVCGDDPGVRRCLSRFTKPVSTYGFSDDCDYVARSVKFDGMGSSFEVHHRDELEKPHVKLGSVKLNVPGKHNVLNALAAITIARRLSIPFEVIAKSLADFRGVKRRFEVRWQDEKLKRAIIDDYGHHPTEIEATLAAARNYWPGRIITVFQPHRYSRTQNCRDGFLSAFAQSDVVLMTDIYAAGEEPIVGIDAAGLCAEIQKHLGSKTVVEHVGDLDSARDKVKLQLRAGDLVLCMGAGSITKLPEQLISVLGVSE